MRVPEDACLHPASDPESARGPRHGLDALVVMWPGKAEDSSDIHQAVRLEHGPDRAPLGSGQITVVLVDKVQGTPTKFKMGSEGGWATLCPATKLLISVKPQVIQASSQEPA